MNHDKTYDVIVGIDPGVSTGIAVWHRKQKEFAQITTVGIIAAMQIVREYHLNFKIKVRFEDAQLRTWFGNSGRERLMGAGSIIRDCKIWEEFLSAHNIEFEAVAPKNNRTKMKREGFERLTGYKMPTNEHGRDAAMLVFGY